jgi:hypothetical protein
MRRNRIALLSTAAAAVFAGVLSVSVARSADEKPAMSPEQAAMMEAFMKAAEPGAEHKKLAAMAGEWDAKSKAWQPDGKECGDGTGVVKAEPILGGRYIRMAFTGEMNGPGGKSPFHGVGTLGYDNMKKKYVSVWMDDMSTGPMIMEGTAEGDVITGTGEYPNAMNGKMEPVKDVTTFIDGSHYKYELHMTGPDGKMYKCMEVVYTKK